MIVFSITGKPTSSIIANDVHTETSQANLSNRKLFLEIIYTLCFMLQKSNENGSPGITHTARKSVTLESAYGTNIWWGLGKAQ
jgi:hypothetical protein